jgi:hypothetical protein
MKTWFSESVTGSSVDAASTTSRCAIRAQASSAVHLANDVDQPRVDSALHRHRDRAVAHRFGHAKIADKDQRQRNHLHQLKLWHSFPGMTAHRDGRLRHVNIVYDDIMGSGAAHAQGTPVVQD